MARNLDIAVLRTFVTVAERASMTAAANALHLTQGAVSQQIKRLEDQIGCVLFARDRKRLRLTGAGERLVDQAQRLLGLNDELCAELFSDPIEGRVRLGIPYDLVGNGIAGVLKRYAERHPRIEVSLFCASSPDLLAALAKGGIDLALAEEPVGPTAGECIAVERLVWIGARGGTAHLRDPLPVSIVAETCAFRPAVLQALRDQRRPWRAVFENGNVDAAMATVRAGLAVTAWLESMVPADLAILDRDSGLPEMPAFSINLHLPPGTPARAPGEMARHLRETLRRP